MKKSLLKAVSVIIATAVTAMIPLSSYASTAQNVDVDTQPVSRVQFVAMLADASGDDISADANTELPFKDIDSSNSKLSEVSPYGISFRDALGWAYSKWIINGDENSTFRPYSNITQQEAACMIARYIDYRYTQMSGVCGTGITEKQSANWAQNSVFKCLAYNIITGTSAENFSATAPLTTATAAVWTSAAQNLDTGLSAVAPSEHKVFADNLISAVMFGNNISSVTSDSNNWAISPYSVRMCLAMLANGANGTSRDEILQALQIDNLDNFNQKTSELLSQYETYQRIMSLNTANSIWLNQSAFKGKGSFLDSFSEKMSLNYNAENYEVTDADSIEKVNSWVSNKTNGKIPSILTERNRKFASAIVNAVYFKAAWDEEFSKELTYKDEFYNADGSTSQLDFMHQCNNYGYYSTPGIEAVKVDYRNYAVDNEYGDNWEHFNDADFSMYFIKSSSESTDLQNFLDQVEFTNVPVKLSIPKFKIEYGQSIDTALMALGINTVYSVQDADLSAMADLSVLPPGDNLYLSTVIHKSYVSIDEKGTEAAAATAAAMDAGSALPSRPELVREFVANEPFFFVIRDNTNKEILFAGKYGMDA